MWIRYWAFSIFIFRSKILDIRKYYGKLKNKSFFKVNVRLQTGGMITSNEYSVALR